VNEIIVFKFDGAALNATIIFDGCGEGIPKARSGMSIGVDETTLYVFGGQDDDSNKLSDMWEFNMTTKAWTQMKFGWADFKPMPRSGHTT